MGEYTVHTFEQRIGLAHMQDDVISNNAFVNVLHQIVNASVRVTQIVVADGSIHKTATGEYYRGKGLPGIYKAFVDNKISNLVVITNDALADCKHETYRTLTNKFVGTYVSWELDYNNVKLPYQYDYNFNS
jgi:hypothetical protein